MDHLTVVGSDAIHCFVNGPLNIFISYLSFFHAESLALSILFRIFAP